MAKEFRPIQITENIAEDYGSYIKSTFFTNIKEYNDQISKLVDSEYELVKGPFLQLSDNYKRANSVRELTDDFLSKEFLKYKIWSYIL